MGTRQSGCIITPITRRATTEAAIATKWEMGKAHISSWSEQFNQALESSQPSGTPPSFRRWAAGEVFRASSVRPRMGNACETRNPMAGRWETEVRRREASRDCLWRVSDRREGWLGSVPAYRDGAALGADLSFHGASSITLPR